MVSLKINNPQKSNRMVETEVPRQGVLEKKF